MKTLLLAAALTLAACRIAPVRMGSDTALDKAHVRRAEYTEKVVNMRREPSTFIARDGSRCQVDPQTFREIRVGEKATCMWEF